MTTASPRFANRWKHVNLMRRVILTLAFTPLLLLPTATIYQHFLAAHAYDMLPAGDRRLYDVMFRLTDWFITDPDQFDLVKGTTWAATLLGYKISDPLAVVSQLSARFHMFWPLAASAVIPVLFTVLFGRFFCGWICPANLLYELADTFGAILREAGLPLGDRRFDRRLKYLVLAVGVAASAVLGNVVMSPIYPPAIVGREIYYTIAGTAAGAGTAFFAVTVLFDLLVAKRGFCRYLCPGGALYSLLGRYRLVRIQRQVSLCNDCTKCNRACMFDLDPMADGFGQECNNCAACIAVCPTGSLSFALAAKDAAPQGPGHLGAGFKRARKRVHTGESKD